MTLQWLGCNPKGGLLRALPLIFGKEMVLPLQKIVVLLAPQLTRRDSKRTRLSLPAPVGGLLYFCRRFEFGHREQQCQSGLLPTFQNTARLD